MGAFLLAEPTLHAWLHGSLRGELRCLPAYGSDRHSVSLPEKLFSCLCVFAIDSPLNLSIFDRVVTFSPKGGITMAARTINLSDRHNKMLDKLKAKLDISLSEVVSRALEMLDEHETRKEKELSK